MGAADSRKLAYSGILLALLMVILYVRTIVPVNQLSLYILASFIIGAVLMETSLKFSIIFYFASVLLTLILPVDKISLLLYYSFFGIYGVIKFLIEKINGRLVILLVKFAYFFLILYLNYRFAYIFIPVAGQMDLPIYLLIPFAGVGFLIYDYVYSLFTEFYVKRIHTLWRRK